jgi:oligopeptidase A
MRIEPLRRAFYEAWTTRASDQGPNAGRWDNSAVMEEILKRRHEAARLLDFNNYADYALATRMAHSADEVLKFLHELAGTARAAAQAEFAELEAFAGRKLAAWDVGFYAERLQRERFSVSQEELRPYFPLPRVLAGLFEVAARLFGVRIQERAGAPVWHPDARLFDIESLRGEPWAASTSTPTRGPTSAAAPGWTSASAASASRAGRRCRWPTSCATSCPPGRSPRRCSRTMTY